MARMEHVYRDFGTISQRLLSDYLFLPPHVIVLQIL